MLFLTLTEELNGYVTDKKLRKVYEKVVNTLPLNTLSVSR